MLEALLDAHRPHWARLRQYVPILQWLPAYKRQYLLGDFIAGMALGVMAVPQSMAYALLANLPPQVGLYATLVPLVVYAIFGTSRVLSIGPVALVSLLTGTMIAQLATPQSPEAVQLALLAAFIVGAVQIVLGLLRMGFVVNFLSHPVLSGFTNAAAIVIALSQVKNLLGIKFPGSASLIADLRHAIALLPEANMASVVMGVVAIIIIVFFHRRLGRLLMRLGLSEFVAAQVARSGGLVVVVLGTLITWLFRLDQTAQLRTVGHVPVGLPPITLPALDLSNAGAMAPALAMLVVIGYVESVSIAKSFASRRREKVDADQELIALGAADIAASFTGGSPVSGSFSRSAVNFASGAATQLSSVFAALVIALTLLFLTPLFYFLPETILAATIVAAVLHLPDLETVRQAWRYSKADWLTLVVTLFGVLFIGVEAGLLIGVVSSLAVHLWVTSRPHVTIIGRVEDTETYKSVKRYKVKTCPHVTALRIDESLYFATAKVLEDTLIGVAVDNPKLKYVVLDCSAVNRIDLSALTTLETVDNELRAMGVTLVLSAVKGPIHDSLLKAGFVSRFGQDRIYLSTHEAMKALGCA
ncbi:MAG: sulfate permease [Anaerolineae bacterium]|nr:sulfate permease [Candidatus Roseilinea sp.]MDW8448472.1 sulfate permease [Anaerolineae bacterium]